MGLARTEAPHSGNCQFFVNLADNPELDPLPVRWGYAVFGKVIDGMDVVDKISTVPTGAEGKFKVRCAADPCGHREDGTGRSGWHHDRTAPKQLAPAPTGNEVLSPN